MSCASRRRSSRCWSRSCGIPTSCSPGRAGPGRGAGRTGVVVVGGYRCASDRCAAPRGPRRRDAVHRAGGDRPHPGPGWARGTGRCPGRRGGGCPDGRVRRGRRAGRTGPAARSAGCGAAGRCRRVVPGGSGAAAGRADAAGGRRDQRPRPPPPVGCPTTRDEIAALGTTINALLDRRLPPSSCGFAEAACFGWSDRDQASAPVVP